MNEQLSFPAAAAAITIIISMKQYFNFPLKIEQDFILNGS